ncbi:DUF2441 domain-containing protein [Methylorubrum extorquens]|uniref:DUF2441 domain-containing protein n=1 Tax=Methylorubrum extorquens TaxID=408 RepID=UPI002238BB75|nr:DUF2441 domain-containing protein [Methylorubrum extorquens]UYW25676.1 DUF2441 domain-containing protein [Methylorubrum extorquens]
MHPGNWGVKIAATPNALPPGNEVLFFNVYRETMLELGRKTYAPNAPSRMNCIFCCKSEQDAAYYRSKYAPNTKVYAVELVDKSSPIHTADFEMVVGALAPTAYASNMLKVERYWTAGGGTSPELLVGGAIRIMREA